MSSLASKYKQNWFTSYHLFHNLCHQVIITFCLDYYNYSACFCSFPTSGYFWHCIKTILLNVSRHVIPLLNVKSSCRNLWSQLLLITSRCYSICHLWLIALLPLPGSLLGRHVVILAVPLMHKMYSCLIFFHLLFLLLRKLLLQISTWLTPPPPSIFIQLSPVHEALTDVNCCYQGSYIIP